MTARPQDYFRTPYDQRKNALFDKLAAKPYGPAFQVDCTTRPCPGNMGPYLEQYEGYTPLGGPNPWKWRTAFDKASLALYNNLASKPYGPAFQRDCTIRPCPGNMGPYLEQYDNLKEGFCGSCGGANFSSGDNVGMWGLRSGWQKKT